MSTFTHEQLAERRKGIGASEAGAVLGLSPFQGPIDIFLSKLGLSEGPTETLAMKLGNRLEAVVADLYDERLAGAVAVLPSPGLVFDPAGLPIFATPDRLVQSGDERWLLEIKTTSHDDGWGTEGTDEVPENHLCQVAVQMRVMNLDRADIAVLNVLRRDFRIYTVRRNLELEAAVLPRLAAFWNDHVLKREPPPLDGSAGWTDYLKAKFPRHGEALVAADDAELVALVRGIQMLKADAKSMGALLDHNENALRSRIADKAGLEGWWGKATWKKAADARKTDWEAVARFLFAQRPVCDLLDWDRVLALFTTTKEGQRRLLVSPSKHLLDTAGTNPQIGDGR